MPELAEVETVKNVLKKSLLNKRIIDIKVLYKNIIENDLDYFKNIIGQDIIDIKRRGKYLIFELNNYYLVSHLRMEGKYFIKDQNEEILKHEHVIFYFSDFTLRYHDTRKFGRMKLVTKDKLYTDTSLKNIGLEPWDKELNTNYLLNKFNCKKPIKTLLLEQSIICGIGNIYADEILFSSKINPNKLGNKLNKIDCQNIIDSTKKILEKAIECGGTTIRSYTSSLGVKGNYQDYLNVHQREGEHCPICNTIIKKIKVGGRGTYYCPKCQGEL